ncbi:LysR family transcriptional regulator [Staphylococcus sp. IVB6238]|uniref:LysR family transcriptional regulator n=1 Tax=Staphylococcus sp. IVB6238 TaxID=2989770 RepID=UPI0021D0CCE2|nr:LysR family transcriptional regulator [Staphylococcus sp. IVB6238]UXR74078.1 LysR family transcriptional regulator [Staphylococcus sp. IVB6238]
MENRVLRYFLTVVSEGNISAAANLLHVTQPTLSRQLKGLEEELGVTLFKRKGKHMTLTQEGRYLAEQANNILNLVDMTTANLAKSHDIYGTVTIGLAESHTVTSIAKAIKEVQQTYPNTRFQKLGEKNYTEKLLNLMDEGEQHITLLSMYKVHTMNTMFIVLGIFLLSIFSLESGINQSFGVIILVFLFAYNLFGYQFRVRKFYK